jgi:hypothetical protein
MQGSEIKPGSLKIVELCAENVRRLRAISLSPGDGVTVVAGNNAQGKSSLLDSILWALGGPRAVAVGVRSGASKARVRLNVGELVIERQQTAGGSVTLTVEDANGVVQKSPQAVLDAIYRETVDPLAFTRMKPAEQADELARVVGLDFTADDQEHQRLYDRRTAMNRDLRRMEAAIPAPPTLANLPGGTIPDQPIRVADLLAQVEALTAANKANEDRGARVTALRQSVADAEQRIAQLRAKIDQANAEIDATEPLIHPPHDTAPLRAQISQAEAINDAIRRRDERRRAEREIAGVREDVERLTRDMEAIKERKTAKLRAAQFPHPGLSLGDAGVMLNGVPFDQASSAEQLRASAAIGLAQNPRLRVLLIRDGSLLDQRSMADLERIAREHDAQLFIERVGDEPGAVVIEDGEIVADRRH